MKLTNLILNNSAPTAQSTKRRDKGKEKVQEKITFCHRKKGLAKIEKVLSNELLFQPI